MSYVFDIQTEDIRFIAHSGEGEHYTCVFSESVSGKTHTKLLVPCDEVTAIATLMMQAPEDLPEAYNTLLYCFAEMALEGVPSECRPIP